MSYQKGDEVLVNTSAVIKGIFISYDKNDPNQAKVNFENVGEIDVPIDSINRNLETEEFSNSNNLMELSDETKKQLERQLQLCSFNPKRR